MRALNQIDGPASNSLPQSSIFKLSLIGPFLARRNILHRRMTSVANRALRKSMGSHLSPRATLVTRSRH